MRAGHFFEALRECPVVTAQELTAGRPFLVLSPHPDDETLGAGGLIASARDAGQDLDVVVVTDGSGSHTRSLSFPAERLTDLRYGEVKNACAILGLDSGRVHFLGFKDASAPRSGPAFDAAVERIAGLIDERHVSTVLVTWEADPHCDHQAAAELAKSVRKTMPHLKLFAYPIWGWHLAPDQETHQPPPVGLRIDIARFIEKKRAAIAAHASQMSNLIADDPDGFRFEEKLLAPFCGRYEYFVEMSA